MRGTLRIAALAILATAAALVLAGESSARNSNAIDPLLFADMHGLETVVYSELRIDPLLYADRTRCEVAPPTFSEDPLLTADRLGLPIHIEGKAVTRAAITRRATGLPIWL